MNSDAFHSSLIDRRIQLLRTAESSRQEVSAYLDNLATVLQSKILGAGQIEAQNIARQFRTIQSLTTSGQQAIQKTYTEIRKVSDQLLTGVARVERTALSEISPLVRSLNTVSVRGVLVEKKPISNWWARQEYNLQNRFANEVRAGLGKGETKQQIVQRILGKRTKKGWTGITALSDSQANALIKTSVQAISNEVLYQTYKANDDLFYGVQWSAVMDSRTTVLCRGRDGMAWYLNSNQPLEDAPTKTPFPLTEIPPIHFNCRSLIIPLTRSKDDLDSHPRLGPLLFKLPPRVRNTMTGKPASRLTYDDWLRTQPVGKQKEILGEARYKLWKLHKITLAEMLP